MPVPTRPRRARPSARHPSRTRRRNPPAAWQPTRQPKRLPRARLAPGTAQGCPRPCARRRPTAALERRAQQQPAGLTLQRSGRAPEAVRLRAQPEAIAREAPLPGLRQFQQRGKRRVLRARARTGALVSEASPCSSLCGALGPARSLTATGEGACQRHRRRAGTTGGSRAKDAPIARCTPC